MKKKNKRSCEGLIYLPLAVRKAQEGRGMWLSSNRKLTIRVNLTLPHIKAAILGFDETKVSTTVENR